MTSPGPGDPDNPVPALGDVPEQRGRRGAAARPLNRRGGRNRSDAPRPEGEAGEPRPEGNGRKPPSRRCPAARWCAGCPPGSEADGEPRPRREGGAPAPKGASGAKAVAAATGAAAVARPAKAVPAPHLPLPAHSSYPFVIEIQPTMSSIPQQLCPAPAGSLRAAAGPAHGLRPQPGV